MSDIIRTWPASAPVREVQQMFRPRLEEMLFPTYYFTLGRGKPRVQPINLWFTWRGRILGYFSITRLVQNDGSLPWLHKINGAEGEQWSPARDAWIAVCDSDFMPFRQRVYMSGFRGWRYFDLESYRQTPESKVRL